MAKGGVKFMEKNPDLTNPRYNEDIFPVPCNSLYRGSTEALLWLNIDSE